MLPPEVNNVAVKQGTEFDRQNNASSYLQYTFYIGNHGPFTEKFYAGEQDTPSVERRINADVQRLREQGLLGQQ